MKKHGIGNIILLLGAALLLLLPLAKINLVSGKISESENRVLASFPSLIGEDGKLTEQYFSKFKSWFNDNIGFRTDYVALNGWLQYNVLHHSPSSKVEIGKDGWMFYTLDNNVDMAKGAYPNFGSDILQLTCERQTRIQEKLAEKGIDYVLVLPASKVSIYPEYIASADCQVRETPSDLLAAYLKENSNVNVIKLKDALLKEKENHQLYFKTDTHWNDWGAYTAYREIITQLNAMGLCDAQIAEVSVEEGTYKGEFSAMMGNRNLLPEEKCPETVIRNPTSHSIADQEPAVSIQNLLLSQNNHNPFYAYENPTREDQPSVLLFGDSLFAYWTMPELFAESFSRFSYIWNNYEIDENIIDLFEPDIVICTIGERYLNQLYAKSAKITVETVQDANAEFLSCDVEGSELVAKIKNTSSSVWTAVDNVRLGVWQNGVDTGYRIYLPAGESVDPGEIVTIVDDDFPFAEDGDYEVQMLQEGIQYFGEKYPLNAGEMSLDAEIVSYDAPSTVNHQDSYTIHITVKNTGESEWSEKSQIRLCIWQDNQDAGYRILLPEGVSVAPGEEYTFTLSGFVLPEADQTTLEFQMLQEGVQYFGEREPAVITAVEE